MKMADELLNIRPDASILGVFSRLNYKPWYAIAEFVDNSTASFYMNENIMKFYKIRNICYNHPRMFENKGEFYNGR